MKKRKPLLKTITQDEKDYLLPLLIKYFEKQTSKSNPKTQPEIEKFFRDRAHKLPGSIYKNTRTTTYCLR
jgi:hypothetical protein